MSNKPYIYVIDDSETACEHIKKTLNALEYSVTTSLSGKDALTKLAENPPDAIILDLFMPEMNGIEVIKKLRVLDKTRDIPIIIVTVSDKNQDLKKALDTGAIDYITKPFDEIELLSRLNVALRLKKRDDQLKETIKDKEQLLRELTHRVKNNLSMIISLIDIKKANAEDKKTIQDYEELISRTQTLSVLYDQLHSAKDIAVIDFSYYIITLIKALNDSQNINEDTITTITTIEKDIILNSSDTINIGMLITELFTNALKYAFPNNAKGTVEIKVSKHSEAIEVIVSDNGIGFSKGFDFSTSSGFGLSLVQLFVKKLKGTLKYSGTNGATFTILIPFEK